MAAEVTQTLIDPATGLNGYQSSYGGFSNPDVFYGNFYQEERQRYFYHPDHLGSTSYVTDASGVISEHVAYFPTGETWSEQSGFGFSVPYKFTSKELDASTGLYYHGARYYDPKTSVWQSADPILGSYLDGAGNGGVYNPANLNLYSYTYQNPVNLVDPDGRNPGPYYVPGPFAQVDLQTGNPSVDELSLMLVNTVFNSVSSAANMVLNSAGAVGDLMAPAEGPLMSVATGVPQLDAATRSTALGIRSLAVTGKAVRMATAANRVDVPKGGDKGGLNLFKWGKESTTKANGWKDGDFMLHLPNKGNTKANWKQNSGHLREQMNKKNPIYDSYRDPKTGQQVKTDGFLNAERKLLESRGWQYDSSTGAYHPPN